MPSSNVLLPFGLSDTKSLRRAAANILRDIQRDNEETDQCTADKLGVSVGTIRNEMGDISSLTLAKIGRVYGEAARGPKGRFDALLAAKDAADALSAWIGSVERQRLRVVA